MSHRFRKGDKVRVVAKSRYGMGTVKVGDEGVVSGVDMGMDKLYITIGTHRDWACKPSDVMLIGSIDPSKTEIIVLDTGYIKVVNKTNYVLHKFEDTTNIDANDVPQTVIDAWIKFHKLAGGQL